MSDPKTEKQTLPPKAEATMADLIAIINKNAEESRTNFSQLKEQLIRNQERLEQNDARMIKVEENVTTLNCQHTDQQLVNKRTDEKVTSIISDVEDLKETVKRLQICINPPLPQTAWSSDHVSFHPATNSTSLAQDGPRPPTSQMYSSNLSSLSQVERFADVVSEFNGRYQDLHPEKFLQQLNQYFTYYGQTDTQRVDLFQRRLTEHARIWFESLLPAPTTYDEAKMLFRQQFWSAATQRKIRNEIFREYQYRSPSGIANHAMIWIAKAKYLSPPVDPLDLIGVIIQHYPAALGVAIRGRGPRTTNELLAVLTEFEESASFCEIRRDNNHPRPWNNPLDERNQSLSSQRPRYGNNRFQHNRVQQTNRSTNPMPTPVQQLDLSGNDEGARV